MRPKDKTWSFSAQVERFDMEAAWHFIAVPNQFTDAVRAHKVGRYIITINDAVTWHCGLLPTGDQRWFVAVSQEKIAAAQTKLGGWVHVDLAPDHSKYGMAVPEDLQDCLDDDPEFLKRFDAMLPGKRRGRIHHIASAKTEATVAKRISKLMTDLGLCLLLGTSFLATLSGCAQPQTGDSDRVSHVTLGNERTEAYLPLLKGKKVAVVGNHTSVVGGLPDAPHLVDTLLALGVDVRHVFAPEHGFRGEAANGADIHDGVDALTGLKVYSLHGKHRKPQPEQLEGLDAVVFDIQDVGARFYTYVSSLMLVMEACAEEGVNFVILDRPNPHGHHLQGPMLQPEFKSFAGWIPTPMVHGMTLGELALMASDEGWFVRPDGWRPHVVPCLDWQHGGDFPLAIRPSPNLPTRTSIDLYPSLCLFEPTVISVGRGTKHPFEQIGHPTMGKGIHSFTPRPVDGAAPHPKHEGLACQGENLAGLADSWRKESMDAWGLNVPGFSLAMFWDWAQAWRDLHGGSLEGWITNASFFDKLAGTDQIRLALEAQTPLEELEVLWAIDHVRFFDQAQPYLLYPWVAPEPGFVPSLKPNLKADPESNPKPDPAQD
ncbi:MAG: DUF1343 domain-containing protein [Bacteroidetes bacterium]|nr:DUF1343 domain-containing protein [Bacteroidota bacterium]MDA0903224.1 DUF1343 domain-containing protein [Bacteroidota bacterium]